MPSFDLIKEFGVRKVKSVVLDDLQILVKMMKGLEKKTLECMVLVDKENTSLGYCEGMPSGPEEQTLIKANHLLFTGLLALVKAEKLSVGKSYNLEAVDEWKATLHFIKLDGKTRVYAFEINLK